MAAGTGIYIPREMLGDGTPTATTALLGDGTWGAPVPGTHTHVESDVTNLVTDLAAKEATANKDAASGYAGLNSSSRVTKGIDTTDYVIVDLATAGLVLKDTQGTPHYWKVTVSVLGVLITTDLGTVKP